MNLIDFLKPIYYTALDADGTLISSRGPWHGETIAETVRRTGFESKEPITAELAQQAYNGPGHGMDYFELLKQNLFTPYFDHPQNALNAFRRTLPWVALDIENGNFFDGKIKPLPGALEALKSMERRGIESRVVTMTPSYLAKAFLQRAGMIQGTTNVSIKVTYINEIFGCELFSPEKTLDPKIDSRQSPFYSHFYSQFRERAQHLTKDRAKLWELSLSFERDGVHAHQCMIAEDGAQGIQGAIAFKPNLLVVLNKKNLKGMHDKKETKLLIANQEGSWETF